MAVVTPTSSNSTAIGEAEIEKAMSVSPFNDKEGRYRIRVSPPTSTVSVLVSLEREGEEPFGASLGERGDRSRGGLPSFPRCDILARALESSSSGRHFGCGGAGWRCSQGEFRSRRKAGRALRGGRPGSVAGHGRPAPAPVRAALAKLAFRRAARRAGIRVRLADGRSFGSPSGPVLEVTNPSAFFARLGRDGKIGFGEAYMAGDWDAPSLVDVLEAMARHVDTLIPPRMQWSGGSTRVGIPGRGK